jgi:hypothetical protein
MWIPEQTFVSSNKTYLIIEYKTCGFVDKHAEVAKHVSPVTCRLQIILYSETI